jgi:hypothetical protein
MMSRWSGWRGSTGSRAGGRPASPPASGRPARPPPPPAVLWQAVATYDREGRNQPPTWHYPDHDGPVPPVPVGAGPNGGEYA